MFKKLTFTTLALLVSGVVIAGEKNLYTDLDANKDGGISKEEATALPPLRAQWMVLDVNSDGLLDKAEFAKMEVQEVQEVQESKPIIRSK